MLKRPWLLFVFFLGWCWLCLHWFCCWMQVACPSCNDEQVCPYAIGYQLDSPAVFFGKDYSQLTTDLLSEKKADQLLEITGKYFSNESNGKTIAQSRANDLAHKLKEDLQLKAPPVLRTQKVWEAAPAPDAFFQAIALQWIDAPKSTLALERIFYLERDGGRMSLSADDTAYLRELVALLNNDNRKVQISGHTDDAGSPVQNKKMGDQRALAVVDALKGLGLAAERISWSNALERDPLVPNTSAANRKKNQRAVLKVIP